MKEEFEFVEESKTELEIPIYGSEEWENYVMSLFTEDELYIDDKKNGYPTLNGMRRISLLVLGDIVKSAPTLVVSNPPVSCYCIYEIQFDNGKIFGAAADASTDNISGAYSVYPTAIAESRAEARAYRKALLLKTASAEEIKGNEKAFNTVLQSVKEYDSEGDISSQQISIIETKCKKLKINKNKFLESENVNLDFKGAKRSDGINLSKKISEFQQKGIPEELKL
jgi:hypothetical protein